MDLVYRNPDIQTVQAQCVYENDLFEYELGLEPKLVHKPATSDRGELILAYALTNDETIKSEISIDMSEVADEQENVVADAEYVETDGTTLDEQMGME